MLLCHSFVSNHHSVATTIRSMSYFVRSGCSRAAATTALSTIVPHSVTRPMQRPVMQCMTQRNPPYELRHSTLSTLTSGHSSIADKSTNAPTTTATMTYHTSMHPKQADAMTTTTVVSGSTTSPYATATTTPAWMNRWIVTSEVAVSKIFPGGFGWQTGSLLAANYYQYSSDSFNFALCTGVGDALGVFGGHCLYYYLKQAIVPSSQISMLKEMHTGAWLGCAAFCSGTVWQPIVTTLQLSGCTFTQVMLGTWLTCSTAFYIGLRAGRTLLPLSTLAKPTYDNSQTDIALSVSIGGATGFFVGTDTAYLPEQNFLLPIVGITDTTSDVMGCTLAGTSTALGFVSSQSVLNIIYPKQKCWND
jgi:hypothetical protein